MSFKSIGFVTHSGSQYELISEHDIKKISNTNLSRLSFGIIESVLSKPITIIFSQGNFNLSPLIACLFAYTKRCDVLVGKPKSVYKETYEIEKETYFSLTFINKLENGVTSKNNFFYKELLLCKGSINSETNELKTIGIEVYPELGTKKYRAQYKTEILEKLEDGHCEAMPKIIVSSLESMLPPTIFGSIKMNFDNEEIELHKFKPKMIIYESINERGYDFGTIIRLIDRAKASDVKLLLHFSWPYLKGVQNFLDEVSEKKYIGLFYFTKNFCKESLNNDYIPPHKIRYLSLEGKKWDIYYPKKIPFNFKVILPISEFQMWNADIEKLSNWNWSFDQRLKDLRNYLNHENINRSDRNTLMFPPILDSMISPSEIKRVVFSADKWASLPIENSFLVKNEESNAVKLFKGMCKDLNRGKDLCNDLKGISTSSVPTKKTLFQAYLIDHLITKIMSFIESKDKKYFEDSSLIVSNLHPNLKTTSSFFGMIDELVSILNYYLSLLKVKTQLENNSVCISINTPKVQFNQILIKNKGIIKDSLILLKKQLSSIKQIEISLVETEDSCTFEIRAKVPVPYLYFSSIQKSQQAKTQSFTPFIFYSLKINKDGSYEEYQSRKIWSDRSANKSSICCEIFFKNNLSGFLRKSYVDIYYRQFTDIEKMPQEIIRESKLLIPGPIPFTTVSADEILVTQGYNVLLLPFKEVIFFAYPGRNFSSVLSHIKLYEDLFSKPDSMIAKKDLSMSLKYTNKLMNIRYPDKPSIDKEHDEYASEKDTPIDTFFRDELMKNDAIEEDIKNEIKSLKSIWKSTGKKLGHLYQFSSPSNYTQSGRISFLVSFENGEVENISFPIGTMIRKEDNGEYILSTVDDLQERDKIYYIQMEDRESIENYLLKLIVKDEIPIETILEPLTALNSFYKTLNTINYCNNFDPSAMKKLYWLTPEQKEYLFNLIQYILHKDVLCIEYNIEQLHKSNIWGNYISFESLINIIGAGTKKITQKKMFLLATELGLKGYKESSFKHLCSMALRAQNHYFFNEDENLLVVGKLLGHQGIIDDYLLINDEGKRVGALLRTIAFSLRRVVNGQADTLNEIDILLEDNIKSCTIEKILGRSG